MDSALLFAGRLALGVAMAAFGWWWGGAGPALVGAALGALLVSRPLVHLLLDTWHGLRVLAWRGVQGRHYAYKGRPLRVVEDVRHARWVNVADLRAIAGDTAGDATLLVAYPSGCRRDGDGTWLRDDALVLHLGREPGATALRLKQWAEREIAYPAQRVRAKLGIRLGAPDAPDDDDA